MREGGLNDTWGHGSPDSKSIEDHVEELRVAGPGLEFADVLKTMHDLWHADVIVEVSSTHRSTRRHFSKK